MNAPHMTIALLGLALCSSTSMAIAHTGHAAAGLGASAPEAVYDKYGCVNCHGAKGKGSCDLRDANRHFPSDASLRAFIDRPAASHPGSRMPAYEHVISDGDYPPLLAHVRQLSRDKN
jgi:cytochrome c553